MATSKLQRQVSILLNTHLGQYTIRENRRPDWLDGLELDFYIEELQVGIEVQGQQHYEYTPYFHESYDAFLEQKERDERKAFLCLRQSVRLYHLEHASDTLQLVEQLLGIRLPTILHTNAVAQQVQWDAEDAQYRLRKETKKPRKMIARWLGILQREKNRDHPRQPRIAKIERQIAYAINRLSRSHRQYILDTLDQSF